MLVGLDSTMLLSELELMTPGGVAGWKQQVWCAGGSGNQMMDNSVQHDHLAVSSSFLKSLPLKIIQHLCDTMFWMVVSFGEPSRTALHFLYLIHLVFNVGIPD